MDSILKSLRDDPITREVLSRIPGAYLVGGFIRDLLAGRKTADRDFVVPVHPVEAALAVSERFAGTIVTFKERMLARIVLGDGRTIDFTRLRMPIADDLASRDFTMNSIAWASGDELIDPGNGRGDIRKKKIRTFIRNNIADDPVRAVRAYRFSSELGWTIDRGTREAIAAMAGLVRQAVPERITLEFFRMLKGPSQKKALWECLDDGVMEAIIPIDNRMLSDNYKKLLKIQGFIEKLPRHFRNSLTLESSQGLSPGHVIVLERLLYGMGRNCPMLRMSSAIVKKVRKAARFIDRLEAGGLAEEDMFDLFSSAPDMIVDIVCLSARKEHIERAQRFGKAARKQIIPSEEIMELTAVTGDRLGRIIQDLRKAQYLGTVRNRREARAFVSGLAETTKPGTGENLT